MYPLLKHTALPVAAWLLAACAMTPPSPIPAPLPTPTPIPAPAPARYQPVSWNDLPGWQAGNLATGFAAWKSGCPRLKNHAIWSKVCADAASIPDDETAIRRFIESRLTPLQLLNADGSSNGLITGYYEPVYPGSLTPSATARYPLYAQPKDLITVALDEIFPELKGKRVRGKLVGQKLIPFPDRAEIARKGLNAPVLAWLNDPLDVQFMQVQGSGRVQLENGDMLRLGYADQNGRPYTPIGRWLVQQGEIPASGITMQSIRAWANANPGRVETLIDSNPSYVFFRSLPASDGGPIGSLGVALTTAHSIAVDPATIPLGSPVFIATTRPDNDAPIQTLVAAQDTGGAIKGSVRADFFWGTGQAAGELAGKMKQVGQLWLLWPVGSALPQ